MLNENELEKAFHRRFGPSFGGAGYEVLEMMKDGWKKISSHVNAGAQD